MGGVLTELLSLENSVKTCFTYHICLSNRKTNYLHSVCFDSPETLLYLDTENELVHCKQFENLEVIRCRFLDKDILAAFEQLKRLEIISQSDEQSSRRHVRNCLKHFLKQGKVLKRLDFKLYFEHVRIVDGTELDGLPQRLELQIRHYRQLSDDPCSDLSFVTEIDYTRLMNLLPANHLDELPSNFFSTFFNLQKVTTSSAVDKDHFFRFLRNCNYLTHLVLVNSRLSKSLSSLPKACDLKHLKVRDSLYINSNFNFILRFKRLESFKCTAYCLGSSFSLAIVALQKLDKLYYFYFGNSGGRYAEIIKFKNTYNFNMANNSDEEPTYEHVTEFKKLVQLCIKAKYRKLDHDSWAKEIIHLSEFYEPASDSEFR